MKKPPKEHDPTHLSTQRKRARMEAVKKLIARGYESLDIARELKLPLRTVQEYRKEIIAETSQEIVNRTVIDYGTDLRLEIDGVANAFLNAFYEAVLRKDVKAMCMNGKEWRETRDKQLEWFQSLGLVHKEPAKVMAAVRFEDALSGMAEATVKAIAEAENADKAMELFILEVGEVRAKQIFAAPTAGKMLTTGKGM